MTKQIKGSLDEIVEAVKKQLKEFGGVYYDTPDPDSPPDANFAFVNMFEIDSDNLNLAIEAALEKFVFDWTRTCECHEMDRHGETFCCNHCGRPVTNQSYSDKTPIVICGEPLRTTQKKGGDDEA